jgi:hypothetical protein
VCVWVPLQDSPRCILPSGQQPALSPAQSQVLQSHLAPPARSHCSSQRQAGQLLCPEHLPQAIQLSSVAPVSRCAELPSEVTCSIGCSSSQQLLPHALLFSCHIIINGPRAAWRIRARAAGGGAGAGGAGACLFLENLAQCRCRVSWAGQPVGAAEQEPPGAPNANLHPMKIKASSDLCGQPLSVTNVAQPLPHNRDQHPLPYQHC